MSFSSSSQNPNSPSTFSFGSPSASSVNSFSQRTAQSGPYLPSPTLGAGNSQIIGSTGGNATPQPQQSTSDGKNDSHQNNNTSNQCTSSRPYQPFLTTKRDGTGASINSSYNSITCMPDYGNLSLEELRLQDYQKGRNSTIDNNSISASSQVRKNESCSEDKDEVLKTQNRSSLEEDEEKDAEDGEEEEEEESDKNSDSTSNQKQQEIPTEICSIEEGFKLYVKQMMKKVIKEKVENLFKEDEMIAFMQETIKDDIRSIIAEKVKYI